MLLFRFELHFRRLPRCSLGVGNLLWTIMYSNLGRLQSMRMCFFLPVREAELAQSAERETVMHI